MPEWSGVGREQLNAPNAAKRVKNIFLIQHYI